MKKLIILTFLAFAINSQAQVKLTKLWETIDLPTPESVLPVGKILYVSLIDGDASKADGKGGVAILSAGGKIINKNWITGLNAPKGMGIYNGKLYAADINEVVVIDIKLSKVIQKIPVKGTTFLNDITVDQQGNVFVSDTRLGTVYKIKDGKVKLYLDKLPNANGLKAVGNDLYILSGPTLVKADQNGKTTVIAKGLASEGDGLESLGKNSFLVSCWQGLVYEIKMDGTVIQLLDTRTEKINTADIGFDAKKRIMFVPTFFKNSVIAYQVN
jgi:hypothetical protein